MPKGYRFNNSDPTLFTHETVLFLQPQRAPFLGHLLARLANDRRIKPVRQSSRSGRSREKVHPTRLHWIRLVQEATLKRQNSELEKQFKVDGYPTFILLDATGRELGRQTGVLTKPAAFIATLRQWQKIVMNSVQAP